MDAVKGILVVGGSLGWKTYSFLNFYNLWFLNHSSKNNEI